MDTTGTKLRDKAIEIRDELEKNGDLSDSGPAAGSVSQEMLNRAMKVAVQKGLFPKHVPMETYVKHWEGMQACIEAALAE